MVREILIRRLSHEKGLALGEWRELFDRLRREQALNGKVLEDIILRRTGEVLEVHFLLKEP